MLLLAESLDIVPSLLQPVAWDVEFHDHAVMHQAVDGRRGSHRIAGRYLWGIETLDGPPKFAVLIGRDQVDDTREEIFRRREEELIDVKVITYDEILEEQAKQIGRIILPGDDEFVLPV